jgi:hypothetical protein
MARNLTAAGMGFMLVIRAGAALAQAPGPAPPTTTPPAATLLAATPPAVAPPAPDAAAPVAPVASAPPPPLNLTLAWRVEQRFRLWDLAALTPADRQAAEDLYTTLGTAKDPDLVYDQVLAFVKAHKVLHQQGRWDSTARAFGLSYVYPKSYVVRIGLTDATAVKGQDCAWSTTIGQLNLSHAPCDSSVTVTLPARANGGGASPRPSPPRPRPRRRQWRPPPSRSADRLFLSFGDSFASGEGNPDLPSNLAALNGGWGNGDTSAYSQRWLGRDAMAGVRSASWIDTGCHRSSFNQHMVATLKYASDRPHEAVTFLSYACSGAAVFNGVLTAQPQPPGFKDNVAVDEQTVSQVEAANRDLCPPDAQGVSTVRPAAPRAYQKRIILTGFHLPWDSPYTTVSTPSFSCGGAKPRAIDAVLLSVGGNDVGFASVIMWALLPKLTSDPVGGLVLTYLRQRRLRKPRGTPPRPSDRPWGRDFSRWPGASRSSRRLRR